MFKDENKAPCGVEKYDQSYGVGYSVGHGDFSPYPRINNLRKVFLEREFNIDIQRAALVTESYRTTENEPAVIRCAKALEHVLDNVHIYIYDDELIIGDIAAPAKAAPVYPEYSVSWIIDELKNHPFAEREHDAFYITPQDQDELLKLLEYWEGHTVSDLVNPQLGADERLGNELGKKVFMTNLYHYGGIGHFVMDYSKLMRVGFGGLLNEAKIGLEEAGNENKDFYTAVVISISAAVRYIKRYAALAREMADKENDTNRKNELLQIAKNCGNISEKGASSFWEALQLWHFATTIVQIESNGHSVSYGRMDQWLYPYYSEDIKNGVITKQFAEELIECAYIRTNNPSKLKDRDTVKVRNGRGWGGESLTIGGVDRDGKDATNDLTYIMLEASAHTRMMNPWVCLRVHENTPYELKVKAFECIRAGFGHPKLYNDETAVRIMEKKGMSIEEARDYAIVGCVEPDLPGREFGLHDAAYVNLVKILDLAINDGICIDCSKDCPVYKQCVGSGRRLGEASGSLSDAKCMDDVKEAFYVQLKYWIERMCRTLSVIEDAHKRIKPVPFASVFFDDCLRKGQDLTEGGARYNFTGPQGCGIASCADALSAVSQLVFDEKIVSGKDMVGMLTENYSGNEYIYQYINGEKVHHFGNDDDYADEYYKWVFDTYCGLVSGNTNPRGGKYTPGVYSVNANVGMGLNTPASLDGRKKGEPLSDNMGPVHTQVASHDVLGPTAISNSVNKVDHSNATNGTLLNWKFNPECVRGNTGLENLINFTDAFFKGGAAHCQFNIMSSAMMRAAMKNPENYRDMLVRVAGYSAYFVELSVPLQMDLINRTELSF